MFRFVGVLAWLSLAIPGAADNAGVFNRAPLASTPFANLPLGSVKAQGWLLTQLQNQRDGLTGNAETVIPEIGPDNGWRGGKGEGWEKGPYYLKGLVSLAYTLEDPELKRKAQVWIDAILASQQADGFYGPGERSKVDWWPRMVVDWALRDYYEATGDPRVIPHLTKYYQYMLQTLPKRPLFDWGKARAADEMDTVFWLYNRTGDASLIEVATLLRQQAWDWVDIYTHNRFQEFGTFYTYHNVNVPQAFKFPLMAFELSHAKGDRGAVTAGWAQLIRDHGLSFGMTSGTEFLCGRSPGQGTEMCSFVEQMLSFYTTTRVLGEPSWADRAEKIAFNGMPAGLTKDFKQYQYYTLPNEVIAKPGPQDFNQEYTDGITPGPHSGCHCCCYNLHMGWPKFAQHSWMAAADGGLAAILYAPTEVTTRVGAAAIKITERTGYPFAESIRLELTPSQPVKFPLHLRVPAWCARPGILVNGRAQSAVRRGSFARIERTWRAGDVVEIRLPMQVAVEPGVLHSVTVSRGPLVYALKIGEKSASLNQAPQGFPDLEFEPTTPWNYALEFDQKHPERAFAVVTGPLPANPFLEEATPVRLKVKARQLPTWGLAASGLAALDPPVSPVSSQEPETEVTLVPIGATTLHVSNFPWIGAGAAARTGFADDFDSSHAEKWVGYGGNYAVRAGRLTLGPECGFMKAVVPEVSFRDGTVAAEVAIGEKGDGGVMLRAQQVAVGPNSYRGYYVGVDAGRHQLTVGKMDGRNWHQLGNAPIEIAAGRPVQLKVTAQGNRIRVFIGAAGQPVYEFTDGDYAAGTVGVREFGAREFAVDKFVVGR